MAEATHLTPTQRRARELFDLESAMAALPPPTPPTSAPAPIGVTGARLQGHLRSDISDDLLREFASAQLGAQRFSSAYPDALRVVLGNQAHAERYGYPLKQNIRTPFATERVMRTIITQMQQAGITEGVRVHLGRGRVQVIQQYEPDRLTYPLSLDAILRSEENALEAGRQAHVWDDRHAQPVMDSVPY
jgi:hypothetical protein